MEIYKYQKYIDIINDNDDNDDIDDIPLLHYLSKNLEVHFLINNPDKIYWNWFSENPNPDKIYCLIIF
jgi:hypothetical protein